MSKSIMHRKEDRTCYLCMILHDDYRTRTGLQEHHAIGGSAKRKLSERYGLKVYLCFNHHTYDGGPEAAHRNTEVRKMLEQEAQKAFERKYPNMSFQNIFGKNYITNKESQIKRDNKAGFTFIENGVEDSIWQD